jgi:hypothetical protein
MIASLFILLIQTSSPEAAAATEAGAPTNEVSEKEVVYQKITDVDMKESEVKAQMQLPTEFFSYRAAAPEVKSFLEERLKFGFSEYNPLGY